MKVARNKPGLQSRSHVFSANIMCVLAGRLALSQTDTQSFSLCIGSVGPFGLVVYLKKEKSFWFLVLAFSQCFGWT